MRIIEILKVIVLGMVEGFTEWLPISSTGHLILINKLIQLDVSPEFMEMFRVVIQLGAILAVVLLYFDRLNPLSRSKRGDQRRVALILWSKIIVACVPAAILGKLLDDWMDAHLYNGLVVSLMLILYGVFFILVENRNRKTEPQITKMWQLNYQTALYIGMFQVLALIPGTSRSGVTILGAARLLSRNRRGIFVLCRHPDYVRREPLKAREVRISLQQCGNRVSGTRYARRFPGLGLLDSFSDELGQEE